MDSGISAQADLSQRFALDTQGFEALKQTARNGADTGTLRAAAKQFEAVFTQMVLKSMRDATPQDGMFDSEQGKLYMSMLDQQLAQQMSSRGIGLAEVMVRQLARATGAQVPPGMGLVRKNGNDHSGNCGRCIVCQGVQRHETSRRSDSARRAAYRGSGTRQAMRWRIGPCGNRPRDRRSRGAAAARPAPRSARTAARPGSTTEIPPAARRASVQTL